MIHVFKCPLRRENKPETGVGYLGGCDLCRRYNRGRTGEAQMARALPGTPGTEIWGAAVLLSRCQDLAESQESGEGKLSVQRSMQERWPGQWVIWLLLLYDTLLNQSLCQGKNRMHVFSGCFGLHLIWSKRKPDLGFLSLQGQNHLSENFPLFSYSPRAQLERKDAKPMA